MSNVQIRGLMKAHKENRRAANEQARELNHLRIRYAYRGVQPPGNWITSEVHGRFVYRGVEYTK